MSEVKEDDYTSPDRCWRERSQYSWMWDNEPKLSVYDTAAVRSCFHTWSPDNQELPFYMQQNSRLSLSVAEDSSLITVFALTSILRISTAAFIKFRMHIYLKLMFTSMWSNIQYFLGGFESFQYMSKKEWQIIRFCFIYVLVRVPVLLESWLQHNSLIWPPNNPRKAK